MPKLSIYNCCENSGNLLVSDTSWSTYIILSMQPNRVGVVCTPSGMCSNTIKELGCLCGDHAMGFFQFPCASTLDVPNYGSLSSQPNSGYPVISSSCNSSCCVDPTIGCGLGPSDSVILWAVTLEGCCEFPVANGS
jgi:hypothetical protein